jgi:hypothetical protein
MLYLAAFDVQSKRMPALGTLTLSASGETDILIDLATLTGPTSLPAPADTSSLFFHWASIEAGSLYIRATDDTAALGATGEQRRKDISYYGFEQALTAYVNAQGWAGTFTIYLDLTTGLVTAAYSGGNFTMTWSTAMGRKLCGFDADKSGAATYTGTVVPLFVIKTTLEGVSNPTMSEQEDGLSTLVSADSGDSYGGGREVAVERRTWWQKFERRERVEPPAASTHPWTIKEKFGHCRSESMPFIVVDGDFGYPYAEAFAFSAKGGPCKPVGSGGDKLNFTACHVFYDCVVLGKVSTS